MPTRIKVAEATIQTVQVSIQALKVGPKQVTMGLFRQLPLATLLDHQAIQLRGLPWGHVNYWWDGDGSSPVLHGNKLHVVWQSGETLHRAIVYDAPPLDMRAKFELHLRNLRTNVFLLLVPSAQSLEWVGGRMGESAQEVIVNHRRMTIRLDTVPKVIVQEYWSMRDFDVANKAKLVAESEGRHAEWRAALPGRVGRERMPNYEESYQQAFLHATSQKQDAIASFDALLAERALSGRTLAEVEQEYEAFKARQAEYEHRWAQQWQALTELPQLFIAV